MDDDGGFHEVEKDGKLFLVYHHPKYRPKPQIKSPSSSAEVANHDHPPLPLFICPFVRWQKDSRYSNLFLINSSPEFVLSSKVPDHHLLPLFWCNNEKFGDGEYECAHRGCEEFPHTIRISRHHHRISRVLSLRYEKWPCGVCRQSIDGNYGAYTCNECGDHYYAVHLHCALGKDVWDGEELKGVPEKDDIAQDAPPFCKISEGVVHYFLHDHHLRLEENILYDKNKFCEACVMPIIEDEFYSCAECDFILHETCLKARRRIQYALHPHPLTLKAIDNYDSNYSWCPVCSRNSGGFVYECPKQECQFKLDMRCALISEPFDYQGHEHPLFLSLDPYVYVLCKCATLPYKVRYNNDKHFLTLSWGEERREKYWCEECEDIVEKFFYWCNDCCTILHTDCLFSKNPYLKPGQVFKIREKEFQILAKSNTSRPICHFCKKPCQGKTLVRDNLTVCSMLCAFRRLHIT
ncbi:Cysteine/Histidine-rich C1 domain family protein [Raphanus sativus]|nr:Cysteine/Histidine-rich C1 domain family protein [Raphanus sativus]